MVKYLEVLPSDKKVTHIKVEVRYIKGGLNVFTGEHESRGYYLSVTPVERAVGFHGATIEGFMAFSGIKQCISSVSRRSDKQMRLAEEKAPEFEPEMIKYVCEKQGLTLK